MPPKVTVFALPTFLSANVVLALLAVSTSPANNPLSDRVPVAATLVLYTLLLAVAVKVGTPAVAEPLGAIWTGLMTKLALVRATV